MENNNMKVEFTILCASTGEDKRYKWTIYVPTDSNISAGACINMVDDALQKMKSAFVEYVKDENRPEFGEAEDEGLDKYYACKAINVFVKENLNI